MKTIFSFAMLVCLGLMPYAAHAQSRMMPVSMIGVGPHGYDWLIGTWSCTNSMPSTMGGPASTSFTAARAAANNAVSLHLTGTNFDTLGYVAYTPKTKTWWNPSVYANGSYSTESTRQTGKTTTWTGTYFNARDGSTTRIRDTYTVFNMSKFSDNSEAAVSGSWKTVANITCTKS